MISFHGNIRYVHEVPRTHDFLSLRFPAALVRVRAGCVLYAIQFLEVIDRSWLIAQLSPLTFNSHGEIAFSNAKLLPPVALYWSCVFSTIITSQ